jgi:hypothetical protein
MTKAFGAGYNVAGKVQLGTATGLVVLDVIDQQFDESTMAHLIQCASLGGRSARIPGFGDSGGTISCEFDDNAAPYVTGIAAKNIISGVSGLYNCYINFNGGTPTFFSIPIIVEKVHYGIPAAGKINFILDWKENSLAGSFTLPTS